MYVSVLVPFNLFSFLIIMQNSNHKLVHKFRSELFFLFFSPFFFLSREKAPNRYGFVEKVVDGMFVQINSVIICFKFHAFLATFQMSRVCIQSTTPMWKADDLRLTRVKDEVRGEVLTFKEVTWSTLRIDANALYDVRTSFTIFNFIFILAPVCGHVNAVAGPLNSVFLLLG